MRLVSGIYEGQAVYGNVGGDGLQIPHADFSRLYPDLQSVLSADALSQLPGALDRTCQPGQFVFTPPVTRSQKILAVGINYMTHIREMGHESPPYPVIFTRYPGSLVGHGEGLVRPAVSTHYDFEGELAVIIGRPARYVKAAEALAYVAGYTCLNDGSIRDFQRHGSQYIPGKNFPSSGACGPWMVTSDEAGDPRAMQLETTLNGKVMQQAEISDMRFSVPEIIEYCSTFTALEPGDIISTGTPGGVGAARIPPIWMEPGDRIEVAISNIGTLSNQVVAESVLAT
jgi:2-keto-4-pentenoate hydratase/2-oxohepta-3-ene-1,7-dioic acid hydratase in catechol pathway